MRPLLRTHQFTVNPSVVASLPSSCHSAGGADVEPVLRIPLPKFARHGAAMRGAWGSGRLGTLVSGSLKFRAYARFCTSLHASRGVKGARPQRHSINFK